MPHALDTNQITSKFQPTIINAAYLYSDGLIHDIKRNVTNNILITPLAKIDTFTPYK